MKGSRGQQKLNPQGRALGTTIGGHLPMASRIGPAAGIEARFYLGKILSLPRKVGGQTTFCSPALIFSDEEEKTALPNAKARGGLALFDHPCISSGF